MKRIILTGGGTAGHVTPNIALIPRLRELGYEIEYIGTYDGIEKELIEAEGIPYHGISSGKLRRYFDLQNFSDPFRVMKGYFQAKKIIRERKPDVIFSKGGFVSVPVVFAAHKCKVPLAVHESDMTPGLANKMALPKADRVCCNFPETADRFPEGVATVTGSPIRQELFTGNPDKAFSFCKFSEKKPTILVMGGSTGAKKVNEAIWKALPELLKDFNLIHLTGQGKSNPKLNETAGYAQFEYIKEELPDLLSLADIIISRAGANAICEFLALRKPTVLVPLGLDQSRGDQILNAASFKKSGYSKVLFESEKDAEMSRLGKDEYSIISSETLLSAVNEVYSNRQTYISAMEKNNSIDAITKITDILVSISK